MKKKKLTFFDLAHILSGENNAIVAYACGAWRGIRGDNCILEKQITEKTRKKLLEFNNVLISACSQQYAPEIKHTAVFIGDKCFTQ